MRSCTSCCDSRESYSKLPTRGCANLCFASSSRTCWYWWCSTGWYAIASAACRRAFVLMCCVRSASQSPGSLYLSFYVIFAQTTKEMDGGSAALFIFSLTYIFSFFIVVLAAVGNDIAAVYVQVLCWGKCFPYQWRSML